MRRMTVYEYLTELKKINMEKPIDIKTAEKVNSLYTMKRTKFGKYIKTL